jgi:hypothetical protein
MDMVKPQGATAYIAEKAPGFRLDFSPGKDGSFGENDCRVNQGWLKICLKNVEEGNIAQDLIGGMSPTRCN